MDSADQQRLAPTNTDTFHGTPPALAGSELIAPALATRDAAAAISLDALTVGEFVATRFVPEYVITKTSSGRRHYQAILKHIVAPSYVERIFTGGDLANDSKLKDDPVWPYLGWIPLSTVDADHVQHLVSAATQKGYSAQTVKHIRNVVRTIYSYAINAGCYAGENPASRVSIPAMNRRAAHSLSFPQILQLLDRMQYPERELALLAVLTNMTIAEICGLQWMYVNLSDQVLMREGVAIPPRSIAVRNRWYRGELAPVPRSRMKNVSISPLLLRVLSVLASARRCGWYDFVLCTKSGRPVNQINLAARRLKRIGRQFGMPWFSWQVLRRSRQALWQEYEARVHEQLSKVLFQPPGPRPVTTRSTSAAFPTPS